MIFYLISFLLDVKIAVEGQIQMYTSMGCSPTLAVSDVGCQPINRPCNPFVLLQLSISNKATECYCDKSECNMKLGQFKTIVGGYLIMVVGIIGILGNLLALGVLLSIKKKTDIDVILTGK